MRTSARRLMALAAVFFVITGSASPQSSLPSGINGAPDRRPGEGDGPFDRLVIRGVTVIDGTGAQPRGPIDIVVEKNRIVEVRSVGVPQIPIQDNARPGKGTKE